MIRLGVAVRVLGRAGLRVRDGRRAASGPHLSVSLLLLREVLLYLASQQIGYYRLATDLAPYLTCPDLPQFHNQVAQSAELASEVGALARRHAIRLTMHLGMHVMLGTPDSLLAERALAEIGAQAALLEALGCGPEGVLVLHIGGPAAEGAATLTRFAARLARLAPAVRARVAVEPDEHGFDLVALLGLHQRCGVPLVFDSLHFQLNNPWQLGLAEALGLALATWPTDLRPEVHFSSQRTEAHLQPARAGQPARVIAPRHGQHADFINPHEFVAFLRAARGLPPFDALLEAKAGDLALLRLRADLQRFAPTLAVG